MGRSQRLRPAARGSGQGLANAPSLGDATWKSISSVVDDRPENLTYFLAASCVWPLTIPMR
jgi:hypothetical protein